jgi:hypothetical protein
VEHASETVALSEAHRKQCGIGPYQPQRFHARRQQPLDPHALNVIAALASPGSRAFWSCHLISPSLYL